MRPLILSVVAALALAGANGAPSGGNSSGISSLPVGQITKEFQFPIYQNGQLNFVLTAAEAKGITINRAETTDLKIDLYTNGQVTTTITSPKADLYVTDRKMRTHSTVKIERADLTATAQFCDFDLATKQYTLRNNVKVVLKNFDTGKVIPKLNNPAPTTAQPTTPAAAPDVSSTPPAPAETSGPSASAKIDALLESPGMYSTTNAPTSH